MNTDDKHTYRSEWNRISQEKYADMLTQISAGLLATGHYTQKADLDGNKAGLLRIGGRFSWPDCSIPPCLIDAETIAMNILSVCDLNPPDCEGIGTGW